MKKIKFITLITFLAIVSMIIVININVQANSSTEEIFNIKDAELLGVRLNMGKDEVEKVLGKPKKIESHYEGALDGNVLEYYYEFCEIRLEPYDNDRYLVSSIYTNRINTRGSRNIKVGDHIETVIKKFPYDKGAVIEKEGDTQIKYLYGRLCGNKYKLDGNNGYIEYDNKGNPITLTYKYEYQFLYMEIQDGRVKSIAVFSHNN